MPGCCCWVGGVGGVAAALPGGVLAGMNCVRIGMRAPALSGRSCCSDDCRMGLPQRKRAAMAHNGGSGRRQQRWPQCKPTRCTATTYVAGITGSGSNRSGRKKSTEAASQTVRCPFARNVLVANLPSGGSLMAAADQQCSAAERGAATHEAEQEGVAMCHQTCVVGDTREGAPLESRHQALRQRGLIHQIWRGCKQGLTHGRQRG